ncbi:MAG: bifunctional [glutamine synthetase] adenylyltransferase/[glutamine synthetase]-adenylyl-L-tyrosine phosphorylase [Pseudomonadota bacterium]|nr:bifunctional [glutamine synthetase] adenylyltransferase/[glutamine synthetase]-adenylyl-L-tyrosine phosphorylase [Pseudomonadota bacterium]
MTDAFAAHGTLPAPFDPARAARALADLGFAPSAGARAVFAAAFGNSPYLARTAARERDFLRELVHIGPKNLLARIEADVRGVAAAENLAAAMSRLRAAKRQAALAVALADIAGQWPLENVTRALCDFADAAVSGALRFLLREAALRAGQPDAGPGVLEATTGLTVLAMGKYGAYELNYSSDIDLVVFYDAARFPFRANADARAAAVELVKGLVKLLSEITADGYVFRVDLRLRPDAGATQVAISTEAAELYYEGMGQNWERAAMIKARACAGDPETGADFLKAIEPFIWRRNLDFAAIEDIHSIKRQIHAHEGHGSIAVAGHNIKLGRGGIREIEFFAQTQQLILGGRDPSLRPRGTLAAIGALRARGLVSDEATGDLTEAYRFLRTLEHRLQMIEDQQTHSVPKDAEGLAHIACFMGFAGVDDFAAALRRRLETVQGHYARLFERSAPLAVSEGSLVFTGVEDDPDTLETLANMGFRDARHVAGAIRAWHHGRIRATRSERARELLTMLMPALLKALAATADPDAAFVQFDRFVTRLPAGVQPFSLFLANPQLLHLVAAVCGSAPRLAEYLGRTPAVLDALLDPGYLGELPARARLTRDLGVMLGDAASYEGALDAARRFTREQIFRVGVQIIEGQAEAEAAGPALANVAEAVIAGLLPVVENELSLSAGRIEEGAFAVVAMGKLGGREMTARSDLDLIFVYDAPAPVESSTGPRPLALSSYYARLAQRFLAALTAQTAEGELYEVDMRLRPTGNKGPVAVSLESFARYHAHEAWTWERLALTRARVIAGPRSLGAKVEEVIRQTLTTQGDEARLFADARQMREKLAAQFPGRNAWDLKFAPGGLVDLEFVAQSLQLAAASAHPEVLCTNTVAALEALQKAGALEADEATALLAAAHLENALMQVLRVAVEGTLDPVAATPGLKALLARAGGARDFDELQARLTDAQSAVRALYTKLMRSA